MSKEPRDAPQFYLTAPSPCPYLPRRDERKVFTHLIGKRAGALNDTLTQSGFRRSQTIAYRPACESCRACVSVRVKVDEFVPSRNLRRVDERNADLRAAVIRAEPTSEQYSLFRGYLDVRHADGGMADMSVLDYSMMVEDSHVETRLLEYRVGTGGQGRLVAVCLTDLLADGLSMVYSFYDPAEQARSLGSFMILDHIRRARRLGLPHLYLGYWVEGSKKMAYKARFLPQERLGMTGWDRVEALDRSGADAAGPETVEPAAIGTVTAVAARTVASKPVAARATRTAPVGPARDRTARARPAKPELAEG